MNRKTTKPFLLVFAALLLVLSIPKIMTDNLRGFTVAMMSPFWEKLSSIKILSKEFWNTHSVEQAKKSTIQEKNEIEQLQVQNQLLRNNLLRLQELHFSSLGLNSQLAEVVSDVEAISAKVIYRTPSAWNSSLWINVGESTNILKNKKIVCKNSPVLSGSSVVGIVDYVGKHQSRIRLITDSGLTPSVRALRGDIQKEILQKKITQLKNTLEYNESLFESSQTLAIHEELDKVNDLLTPQNSSLYLAKGELRGNSEPLWRSQSTILKGIGFNYDFNDSKGSARDLRTGKPFDSKGPAIPLIRVKDILVTTGLDGVFPADLKIAEVTKIKMLNEGDYYYELEAKPTAEDIDDLCIVWVLTPLGYDRSDQPPVR